MNDENDVTTERLRRLEQRLEQASETAQRLTEAALRAVPIPPAGFEPPADEDGAPGGDQLESLLAAVRALRELIPADLQRRLAEALRELLLAMRALIDWYVARLERAPEPSGEVKDIPIL